jgi:ketosteroid isomerase-like protein
LDPRRQRLLDAAEASPACVAKHDKAGWLALFAEDGVVEDPVGSAPNRKGRFRGRSQSGDDELGRFYETFIAPNEIRFEVLRDIVTETEVVRDVVIHTTLSTGLKVSVPAYLIYDMIEEDGEVRIARLAAHWELPRLSLQTLRGGRKGWSSMLRLSGKMLRIQGLKGMARYSKGMLRGIFGRGRVVLDEFCEAVGRRDEAALAGLFVDGEARIALPVGQQHSPHQLLEHLEPGARLIPSDPNAAGWTTGFRFELKRSAGNQQGVGFLEFRRGTKKLVSARFYLAAAD